MTRGKSKLLHEQLPGRQSARNVELWFFGGTNYFVTIKIGYNFKGNFLGYRVYERNSK